MEHLLRIYMRLMDSLNFRSFQNELSQKVYDTLAQGYISHSHEVALVGRLVEAVNGAEFDMIRFHADKIHGSKSWVEFNYRDKPATKEIADMVIICIASDQRERVYQKITFIQNKVDNSKKWEIDEEQLFLLKNFPKFSGSKGIFKSFPKREVTFLNHSRCLGSYGLFVNPGEMIFMSAPLLSELKSDKSISLDAIKVPETETTRGTQPFFSPFLFDHPLWHDMLFGLPSSLRRFGFAAAMIGGISPFLNNSVFSRDIYDFIRNWSQFNIGEPTFAFGNVINPDLDNFSNFLLRLIGVGEYVDLPSSNIEGKFDNEMALFAMHMDLSKEMKK